MNMLMDLSQLEDMASVCSYQNLNFLIISKLSYKAGISGEHVYIYVLDSSMAYSLRT